MSSDYEDIPQFDDEDLDTSTFDESDLEQVTTQSDADDATAIEDTTEVAEEHSARDEIYDNESQWDGYGNSDVSSAPGQTVETDLTVNKHLTVGGNTIINGSTLHQQDVLIKGWLVAPNIWKLKETVAKVLNDNPLYLVIDTEDGDSFMAWGDTKRIICRVFRGFTEVTDEVINWSITRDSGSEQDDTAWKYKTKVKAFAGSIEICFNDEENDLGSGALSNNATVFTVKAELPDTDESATAQLVY